MSWTQRIVLQRQREIVVREGDEDCHAREGADASWRVVVRHGQLAGGLCEGPPGTAQAFTKLQQQPVDLATLRSELCASSLDGLRRLAWA